MNWTLSDDFSLKTGYRYNPPDTPLRSLYNHSYMRQWSIGFLHKPDSGLSWGGHVLHNRLTDGNDRKAFNIWLDKSLWQTPRYKLSGILSVTGSENDPVPVSYFNPLSDRHYQLALRHHYRLKLSDHWDLDQSLNTSLGQYHQSGYSPELGWQLEYSQKWRWKDQLSFTVGAGHNKSIYDGEPEHGLSIFASFELRFVQ
ncbi:hypothetical protein [Hahella ganghwensis]|uniref:hypothetical protein n=1 Tax=Hahella ganghwensis TaxID=286420 RepID=UPI00039AF857|nr:hypothetical protein [Hahella ganghwensis]